MATMQIGKLIIWKCCTLECHLHQANHGKKMGVRKTGNPDLVDVKLGAEGGESRTLRSEWEVSHSNMDLDPNHFFAKD